MHLLRTEFTKALLRPRTIVLVSLGILLPFILISSFGDNPARPRGFGDDAGTFRLAHLSGVVAGPALMRRLIDRQLMTIVVALFAGEVIAAEAAWGNLRYLLIRPVRRVRLLAAKTVVALTLSTGAVMLVMYATAVAGALKLGVQPIHVDGVPASANAGLEIPTFDLTVAEQWARCGWASIYIVVGFGAVIGLGILFSTLADSPAAAMGGTVGAWILSQTFESIDQLGSLRYGLPTYYREAWRSMFVEDAWITADIVRGAVVNGVWFTLAWSAAAWWFGRKDIHS